MKNIEPGFVGTELGDGMRDTSQREQSRAARLLEILKSEDIADAIGYAVSAPARVNVAELIVVPTAQG